VRSFDSQSAPSTTPSPLQRVAETKTQARQRGLR
jgi:hypothetical protein